MEPLLFNHKYLHTGRNTGDAKLAWTVKGPSENKQELSQEHC